MHLFDLGRMLVLFGFLLSLGLFVTEFSEIDDAADGWGGIRGNFDQVDAIGAGQVQGIAQLKHTQLFAIQADYSDFAGTDFPINPDKRT